MNFLNVNGKLVDATSPVLLADNRGYRYGDGLFETIKVQDGTIQLENYHFERLFQGLETLRFRIPPFFSRENISNEINDLCNKNHCSHLARVRLSVSRGNGGLYDGRDRNLQYIIEAWPLQGSVNKLNENGLVIGVYPHVRKSCDMLSAFKTANFLPYTMAAIYAKENKLNDCLLLNTHGRICDSTIANLFAIKEGKIMTPPLREGCISGVMRKKILDSGLEMLGLKLEESALELEDLLAAEEIFLTNAINGIRWVETLHEKSYSNKQVQRIHKEFLHMTPAPP